MVPTGVIRTDNLGEELHLCRSVTNSSLLQFLSLSLSLSHTHTHTHTHTLSDSQPPAVTTLPQTLWNQHSFWGSQYQVLDSSEAWICFHLGTLMNDRSDLAPFFILPFRELRDQLVAHRASKYNFEIFFQN